MKQFCQLFGMRNAGVSALRFPALFSFVLVILLAAGNSPALRAEEPELPLYLKYQPKQTSRTREATEWSNFRSNSSLDQSKPRVLLIGDSIVAGYQGNVTNKLKGKVNVTFWASSKCVTDPQYFQELDFVLGANQYDVISYNNGLHSLGTDRAEWEYAYSQAVKFIRAKCPSSKLYLTNSTPLKDPGMTEKAKELNLLVEKTAKAENLPVIDLFGLMDPLDRQKYWSDTFHYHAEGRDMQASKIVEYVLKAVQ